MDSVLNFTYNLTHPPQTKYVGPVPQLGVPVLYPPWIGGFLSPQRRESSRR